MKKLSYIFIILGFLLCGYGAYDLATQKQVEEPVEDVVTQKEIDTIINYISNKYNKKFEFVSRVSRFCLIQSTEDLNNYVYDEECSKHQITDYIYKVKDEDGLEFYIKDVDLEDNITLFDSLKSTQSAGFYDNYIVMSILKDHQEDLLSKFTFLEKIKDSYVYSGLGVEDEHINNKYIYQKMSIDNSNYYYNNMSFNEFLKASNTLGYSFDLGFYIKVDMSIDENNFKDIVNSINESDVYNLGYDIRGKNIKIEFNDNRYIDFKDGINVTLYEYKDNVFEKDSKKLFDSILINNDSFSKDGITLNSFNKLSKIEFK